MQTMKTMMKTLLGPLGMAALLAPAIGQAHHSAARFDFSVRDKAYTGVVKEFSVANPHTVIILEVSDEQGTREVEFEGHSRNNYYRSGWRKDMVNEGDTITVEVAPLRNGEDGGYALAVVTEDGERF